MKQEAEDEEEQEEELGQRVVKNVLVETQQGPARVKREAVDEDRQEEGVDVKIE